MNARRFQSLEMPVALLQHKGTSVKSFKFDSGPFWMCFHGRCSPLHNTLPFISSATFHGLHSLALLFFANGLCVSPWTITLFHLLGRARCERWRIQLKSMCMQICWARCDAFVFVHIFFCLCHDRLSQQQQQQQQQGRRAQFNYKLDETSCVLACYLGSRHFSISIGE